MRKNYFDSNIVWNENVRVFIFLRIILKRTLTEAHVYMGRHQGAKCKHIDVSDVIYHKFSHDATSYTLNGENVSVTFELMILISAVDLLSDSTGNDMVMMTIKNFDFLDNEIEEYEVNLKILFIIENQPSSFHCK